MAIRKILLKNKGFVLPLVLVILLVISFMSLWCNKDLLLNIYSTVSQREFNQNLDALESGIRWTIINYLRTSSVDNMSLNSSINKQISIHSPNKSVRINVQITYRGVTNHCSFHAVCCRKYEIKAYTDDGLLLKVIGMKVVPNPEQDEEARRICTM